MEDGCGVVRFDGGREGGEGEEAEAAASSSSFRDKPIRWRSSVVLCWRSVNEAIWMDGTFLLVVRISFLCSKL